MNKHIVKRIAALALALCFVMSMAAPAMAIEENSYYPLDSFTAVTNCLVYFRYTANSAAGTNKIMDLPKGTAVTVIGENGSFYCISYGGYQGFAYKSDISTSGTASGAAAGTAAGTTAGTLDTNYTTITQFVGVTNSTVYLRYTPNKAVGTNKIMNVPKGSSVTVYGKSGSTWYFIDYSGTQGWAYQKDIDASSGSSSSGSSSGILDTNYTYITQFAGVTNSTVYLRYTPNKAVGVNKIMNVAKGSSVTVIGTYGSTWYFIDYNGTQGWAYQADVDSASGSSSSGTAAGTLDTSYTSVTQYAGVANSTIYLRYTADKATGANKIMNVPKGSSVTVLGTSGSTWSFIQYNGTQGWAYTRDISVPSTGTSSTGTSSTGMSNPSGNVWGHITVSGTNIDLDIMSNRKTSGGSYYYNDLSYGKSCCYALLDYSANPAVIMGHNMRTSRTGFHALHHVQNGLSNGKKCEKCGGAAVGTSTFYMNYAGYSTWSVVAFFETPSGTSSSVKTNTALNGVSTFLSYCSQFNGTVLGNPGSMNAILITCGDTASNSKGAGLYFLLTAVG